MNGSVAMNDGPATNAIRAAVVLILLPIAASAQPPAPPRQSPVPREAAAPAVGSATIRGRVLDSQTGRPLRGVVVSARLGSRGVASALTDGAGRYEIVELTAGRYGLTARADGYLQLSLGQTRPNQAEKPLSIADRQVLENVDFLLPRGGAIAGVVRDENNDPVPNQQVRGLTPTYTEGRRQLTLVGELQLTNDRGEYRIYGLPPGSFYVTAVTPGTTATPPESAGASFAPTFYPNTGNLSEAQRVAVKLGEVVANIDITLRPVKFASISATVLDADGRPLTSPILNVRPILSGVSPVLFIPRVELNGSFIVTSLSPADYELQVTGTSSGPERTPLVARATVTVAGEPVAGVRMTATKMAVGTGRVIIDTAGRPQLGAPNISVADVSEGLAYQPRSLRVSPSTKLQPDLTFTVTSGGGRGTIQIAPLPRGYFVKAIRVNGADVSDSGIEFPDGGTVSGIEVELTNQMAEFSGTVRDGAAAPEDYTAIVFARDPARRKGLTRYFGTARPDASGRFVIGGLPAGEYFAVALEWADTNTAADPDFLESLTREATPLTLADGEAKALELTLRR